MSFAITILAVAGLTAGCTGGQAYVDKPWEIDRELSTFPNGPTLVEGSTVTVCYAKSATTPAAIFKLADDECGRFGMTARIDEQIYTLCPMTTPIAAVYTCAAKVASNGAPVSGAAATGTAAGMPTMPAQQVKGSVLPEGFGAGSVSTTAKSDPFPTFLYNDPNRPAR